MHLLNEHSTAAHALTDPFWVAAGRGEFLVQVDDATGQAQFYPRPVSLVSGSQALHWTAVSGRGKIAAITTLPSRTGQATWLAIIELDERVRVLGTLVGNVHARIGDTVLVHWRERPGGTPMFAFCPA